MSDAANHAKTSLGALMLGGMFSMGLSGMVAIQCSTYARSFSHDSAMAKTRVATVFLLDWLHTAMIMASNYTYFVDGWGDNDITDQAPWTIGISIALTAITTLIVHLFFTYRLYRLSKGNFWITVPIAVMAVARLGAACTTAAQLTKIGTFSGFGAKFSWVFTLGLALSCGVDVCITGALCYFLRRTRTGTGRLDYVVDQVTLYTVENGLLTSITVVVSMVFWLAQRHVLIYLGLHFAISKLYANSFLAAMNARETLRVAQSQSHSSRGVGFPMISKWRGDKGLIRRDGAPDDCTTRVQITVDRSVEVDYAIDDDTSDRKSGRGAA